MLMMNVMLLSQSSDKISFRITETDPVFVNTLRRVIMEEVPTIAIHEVHFRENSSALYDEMLALRLGLIPLKTDLDSYVFPEEAKNESDPRVFVNFKLKAKGPCTVYASDLQSQDPQIEPAYKETIIVTLLKDQKLEFDAVAILGRGKQHMKFAPGLMYYHHVPLIQVKKRDAGAYKDKYPPQIFNAEGHIDPKLITKYQLVDACKHINPDIIEIKDKEDSFDVTLELWGQLSARDVLGRAFAILGEKLETFEKLVHNIK